MSKMVHAPLGFDDLLDKQATSHFSPYPLRMTFQFQYSPDYLLIYLAGEEF
jgi:hypothetical protein